MEQLDGTVVGGGDFVVDGFPFSLPDWLATHYNGDYMVSTETGIVYQLVERPQKFEVVFISANQSWKSKIKLGEKLDLANSGHFQNVRRIRRIRESFMSQRLD